MEMCSFGLVSSSSGDDKQKKFESWKNKQLANYFTDKSVSSPQGVSTAMDARLETSIELAVELRLKVGLGSVGKTQDPSQYEDSLSQIWGFPC